ncbi:MAG: glycerate kinase [Alkalispirochaeta sp.]
MKTKRDMTVEIRTDAMTIVHQAIKAVLPHDAVRSALCNRTLNGPVTLVSIGKAAWTMARAAVDCLGETVVQGAVLTKYGHSEGPIDPLDIWEAGHPIPDEASIRGTKRILDIVTRLGSNDQIVLLLSGGGSSLFESPAEGIHLKEISDVTGQLLASGADIVEVNTIRKRLSAVKGGKFARACKDTPILAVVLSDVLGNRLDSIASGPVSPDLSTSAEAAAIVAKYDLHVGPAVVRALADETPKAVDNCEAVIAGSVEALCEAAAVEAERLGYEPLILTTSLQCEAREAGSFMASLAAQVRKTGTDKYGVRPPCIMISGGETVVRLAGTGKGGRNQELALAAALGIKGLEDVVVVSVGSDGTDGPTDAAGGIVDGGTVGRIAATGIEPEVFLDNNDSYRALITSGDLIITGPTGTNVNDLVFVLCR